MLSACRASAQDESAARVELYSQWLSRPEARLDRSTGAFQETRLRYSVPTTLSNLIIDGGLFWLTEWVHNSNSYTALSPYLGLRLPYRFAFEGTSIFVEPFFQARTREVIDAPRGASGWDPRTGLSVGIWRDFGSVLFIPRVFVDGYGDAVIAPKFSNMPLGTLFLRAGSRFFVSEERDWKFTSDIYSELFYQEAANVDLGTRRTEARIGAVGSVDLTAAGVREGLLQIRVYEGWPLRNDGESRSRFEALMTLGVAI